MNPNRKTRSLRIALMGVLLLLCSFAVAQTVQPTQVNPTTETAQATISASGSVVYFADKSGTLSNTFEFIVSGGPSTVSISVFGCGTGGTCGTTALAASTTAANQILSVTPVNLVTSGSVTNGTFISGEQVVQTTSGAVATLIGNPTGANPMITGSVAGSADAVLSWVGQTSGAVFTPDGTGMNQQATGPFDRFEVVITWTGGASPSVAINRTGTTS